MIKKILLWKHFEFLCFLSYSWGLPIKHFKRIIWSHQPNKIRGFISTHIWQVIKPNWLSSDQTMCGACCPEFRTFYWRPASWAVLKMVARNKEKFRFVFSFKSYVIYRTLAFEQWTGLYNQLCEKERSGFTNILVKK